MDEILKHALLFALAVTVGVSVYYITGLVIDQTNIETYVILYPETETRRIIMDGYTANKYETIIYSNGSEYKLEGKHSDMAFKYLGKEIELVHTNGTTQIVKP